MKLSSLVLSTSHVQRTRRTDRSGLGQSRGATLENERSPAASRQSRQPRVAQSRSCSCDVRLVRDALARSRCRLRHVRFFAGEVKCAKRPRFLDYSRRETLDAATKAFVGPSRHVEHARQEPCSLVVAARIRILRDPPRVPLIREGRFLRDARCVATRSRYRVIVHARASLSLTFPRRTSGSWITENPEA